MMGPEARCLEILMSLDITESRSLRARIRSSLLDEVFSEIAHCVGAAQRSGWMFRSFAKCACSARHRASLTQNDPRGTVAVQDGLHELIQVEEGRMMTSQALVVVVKGVLVHPILQLPGKAARDKSEHESVAGRRRGTTSRKVSFIESSSKEPS